MRLKWMEEIVIEVGEGKKFIIYNVGSIIFMNVKIIKNRDMSSGVKRDDGKLDVEIFNE